MNALLDLICRRESPADIPAIQAVETAAFGGSTEATLVDNLRNAGGLVLSAVADFDRKTIGHIAFSAVVIESENGSFAALALAPIAVHPDWQRKGVGTTLIKWSLNECRCDGHQVVIVLGHPQYYPRFGFVRASPLGILCPFEAPDEAFQLLELQPGALAGRVGTVRYRPEFAAV